MTKSKLLSTAAIALLFGIGAASAQNMKKDESPAAQPRAQQSAPAEKIAPPMQHDQKKAGAKPAETTGQAAPKSNADKGGMGKSTDKEPAAKTGQNNKAGAKPAETTGQAAPKSDADKGAAGMGKEKEPAAKSGSDMKGKANQSTQQAPAGAAPKSTQSTTTQQGATTGQGAAAGSAKLSTEQRTKITTVIKQQNVQRVEPSKLNISIRVGARVPTSVRFYPLPVEVITIYPEWRGYDYILVGDEILVINPRTHEIVAILEA